MGYVIAAVVAVVIIGGFIVFLVTNATKKSNVSDAGDPGADQNPLSIIGSEGDTPLGDTSEHAGEQDGTGRTTGKQDAEHSGGTGAPPRFNRGSHDDAGVARPLVGGEGEGERSTR